VLLANKVALITGASRGIGAAAAHAFAAAGATVVLAARDAEALEQVAAKVTAEGGTALAVPTDITNEEDVIHLVATAVNHFGALHLSLNNAGGGVDVKNPTPVDQTSTESFDHSLEINLRGAYLCIKHEVPAMLAAGGGAIVNTSSLGGLSAGVPGVSSYVAAKHGLQGLTKAAAVDYAAKGIRVNAVAPGPIRTEMLANAPQEMVDKIATTIPMRRVGRMAEVAAAAVWLCSDQAAFITGATLPVDGGMLAAGGH
jgi:NAD(P)-dependent dehydrogenase (short-subunit alcohol dehydrogenase family)